MAVLDRNALPAKVTYFFLIASKGCFRSFLNIFFVSIGLSVTYAGFISGFRNLISCLSTPCWSFIGKITKHNRFVFWALTIISILLITPMPWIASKIVEWDIDKRIVRNCSNTQTEPFSIRIYEGYRYVMNCDGNENDSINMLFLAMLSLNLGNAVFSIPLPLFIDRILRKFLKRKPGMDFDSQRTFGALGFGFSCLIVSFLCNYVRFKTLSSYSPVFMVYAPLMTCLLVASYFFFRQYPIPQPKNEISKRNKPCQSFVLTFSNFNMVLYLITIILMGISTELVIGFLFIFLSEFSDSVIIMGTCIFVANLSEFLFYPFTNQTIRLLKGPLPAMGVAAFVNFFRFLLLSFITKAWMAVPIQLLHAVGYGLFIQAMKKQIKIVAPKKIFSLLHSFLHMAYFNVASVIAHIAGGVFYDKYGGRKLFRWASFIFLLWTVVLLFQILFLLNKRDNEEPPEELQGLNISEQDSFKITHL